MKFSNEPTDYLLVKAGTGSEWDNCDFAVIHATTAWKKTIRERLVAVKPFSEDPSFQSLNYYDASASFHAVDEDELPDLDELMSDKSIVFVDLDESEAKRQLTPESRLDGHSLEVFNRGTGRFTAYGKHTEEQFWTDEFSLQHIVDLLKGE